MTSDQTRSLRIFAPAKINLYLHITGRLDNGYHTLDSLIGFADIGDEITIEPALDFTFKIKGPYADAFNAKEHDASPHSSNLVVQAAWALSRAVKKSPNVKITLTKQLPLAAGIGGGSSNAASVIWGLCEWWNISRHSDFLFPLTTELGADVPVCLNCRTARVLGIGEIIEDAPEMDETAIVLANPGKPCPTAGVFAHFDGRMRDPVTLPEIFSGFDELVDFLAKQHNDLDAAACRSVPEIGNVIKSLQTAEGCALARMSGAGATCFGLFESAAAARKAASSLRNENPDWWVESGFLGRPERY